MSYLCIESTQKHDLIEISEAYDIKKDKLRKGQKKIKIEQSEVLNKKGLLERLKNGENAKYTRVIENIKNQEDALKQALHKHIEKIRNEVDQDQKTVLQSIDADLDTISRSMHQSNETNTEIEDLINSTNSAKFFFHEVSRMENSMDVPAPKTKSTYKSIPDFVPGEINQFNVGVLQSKNTPLKLSVSLNIHKQYETELHHVSDIIPCYDNSIWLNSSLYGKLIKVKANRRNLKTISSLSIKVYGMTLTTDNDILLSIGNHNIQHLSNTTGKINTAYNMSPFHSNIIHSTRNNKVIVGVVDSNVQYKVIVINKKGEHETVYEHDQHNQRLFKYPNSITSTDNGNIHVADYAPDSDRGRVVVLGQDGSTINIYTGHPYINKDTTFQPFSIVTTPRDNVIVIGLNTNTLHILDNDGQLLTFYKTSNMGILWPYCLAFTQTGKLLIGCSKQVNNIAKEAKIYEVTISEC